MSDYTASISSSTPFIPAQGEAVSQPQTAQSHEAPVQAHTATINRIGRKSMHVPPHQTPNEKRPVEKIDVAKGGTETFLEALDGYNSMRNSKAAESEGDDFVPPPPPPDEDYVSPLSPKKPPPAQSDPSIQGSVTRTDEFQGSINSTNLEQIKDIANQTQAESQKKLDQKTSAYKTHTKVMIALGFVLFVAGFAVICAGAASMNPGLALLGGAAGLALMFAGAGMMGYYYTDYKLTFADADPHAIEKKVAEAGKLKKEDDGTGNMVEEKVSWFNFRKKAAMGAKQHHDALEHMQKMDTRIRDVDVNLISNLRNYQISKENYPSFAKGYDEYEKLVEARKDKLIQATRDRSRAETNLNTPPVTEEIIQRRQEEIRQKIQEEARCKAATDVDALEILLKDQLTIAGFQNAPPPPVPAPNSNQPLP